MTLRTGSEYVESLRDGRQVWISGARVEDVPSHPAFAGPVQAVAKIYDLQSDPAYSDLLTVESDGSGQRFSRAYQLPTGSADLKVRRRMVEMIARRTAGVMGRLPDYGAAWAIGTLSLADSFGKVRSEYAGNVERWYAHWRDNDLSLVTSFVDPQVDRTKPAEETGLLHIVKETDAGVVVRGVKSVATFGPLANEIMIVTAPRRFSSAREVIYAAIPVAAPGLRLYCREPASEPRSLFDRPLGSRFDEPDAWVIFDDVLIPHERLFLAGEDTDPHKVGGYFKELLGWAWFHNLTRISVKADLLAGVGCLMSEYLNTWQYPQVQEAVGEIIEYAETIRAFLRAAEEDCVLSAHGIAMANPSTMSIAKLFAVKNYSRMLEVIREISGQGIIMAPNEADIANPIIGPTLESYYAAHGATAHNRIKLFHLAWELACDSFAGRQMLFELFNAGGLTNSKLGVANSIDKQRYLSLVKEIGGIQEDELQPAAAASTQST